MDSESGLPLPAGTGRAAPAGLAALAQQRLLFVVVGISVVAVLGLWLLTGGATVPADGKAALSSSAAGGGWNGADAAEGSCRYRNRETYDRYTADSVEYEIAFVADQDKGSRLTDGASWGSVLQPAVLRRDAASGRYALELGASQHLVSRLNEGGRGMELSDLTFFAGALLAGDDRTGTVFEILGDKMVPRWVLPDGNLRTDKGMKIEWMSVRDGKLVVGSSGKDWTTADGAFLSNHPKWIKVIAAGGHIEGAYDWSDMYRAVADAAGIADPGYLWHEAVQWNPRQRRWVFMPRRESLERYDEALDEERGSNLLISVDSHGGHAEVRRVGERLPLRGTSAFQFVPWREDELLVLRSEEHRGAMRAYVGVYTMDGAVLMEDTLVGDYKFEGVEFV